MAPSSESAASYAAGKSRRSSAGPEIDLRDARVSQAPALLDVTCMFGGAEIRAPDEWNIRTDVLALFGGVSDERRGDADAAGPVQLSIQGVVLFGGLTIKD